jgi:hypothetical protein
VPLLEQNIIDFYDTVGGIDTISSSLKLGNTKLRDAQNINFHPIGGYQTRKGYSPVNSTAFNSGASVTGVYMARFSSGTSNYYMVAGNKIGRWTTLSGSPSDITGAVTITAGSTNLWNFAMLNDTVVAANDVDTTITINSSGTTAALAGTPAFTSCLFPIEFRGYMFYCNTVESATRQPDRLRFSDINNPASFTMLSSNNFIDVAKKAGGDVRGAAEYKGDLYVWKRHGIYQINYQPTRVNSAGTLFPFLENPNPIVPGVGTQSHRSICKFTTPITNTQQGGVELVFFVDQFGVPRLFDGRDTVQVGYPITKSRDTAITSLENMDSTRRPQVWAMNYPERNQILVFMSRTNSLQNDICWVLDYSVGFAWGRMKFADGFNCGALFEKSNGTFRPFFGNYGGITMEYDTGTNDNGAIINWYAIHGDAFNQSPAVNSIWTQIELRGDAGSTSQLVNVDFYVDGDDTPAVSRTVALAKDQAKWDEVTWDDFAWAGSGLTTKTQEINTAAKTLRVKVSQSSLNYASTIEGFSLHTRPIGTAQS